jgi:putative drug exporter of the RND superfamily
MSERLTSWSARRPWRAVGIWALVALIAIALVGAFLGDALTSDDDLTNETEARRAEALMFERLPQERFDADMDTSEVVIVRSPVAKVGDRAFESYVVALSRDLRRAGASRVVSFYESRDDRLVSADRDSTALLVAPGRHAEDTNERLVDVVQAADNERFEAHITGEFTSDADFSELALDDLKAGELTFGLPAAIVVLLLVFGAVVAGLLPLLLAMVAILIALAMTAVTGQFSELSDFTPNMLTGMGLALGIDYSLLIISRYREERLQGLHEGEAASTASAHAGRAVLFSGGAFIVAMLGLFLVPHTLMRSLAAGAIFAAVASVLVALTLLPALLTLLGDKVNALRVPFFGRTIAREGSPFWSNAVGRAMRRPWIALIAVTALLLAATVPVLDLESGEAGVSTLPDRLPSKQGFVALNQEFPGETADPVEIVLDAPTESAAVRRGIERLENRLAESNAFGNADVEESPGRDLAVLTVPVAGDALGQEAADAVRELRSDYIPQAFAGVPDTEVLVAGETARAVDESDTMEDWLPVVLAFVLTISFVLLTVAFRSIVVAIKAVVLNLLSVGAAYGLVVLVFHKGVGNELLGFQQVDAVEAWVPLFLFAVLFGLSMDYEVFLLSRIQERFRQTHDNTDAVIYGVATTARIITGAALIIIAVFSGFARGDLVMFQQMGFGVAVALLIDATIVRLVLLPATMQLLGDRNWYLPKWLQWLPEVRVERREPSVG